MSFAQQLKAFASSNNILLVTKIITVSSIGLFAGGALNYNAVIMPSLRKFASSSSLAVWAEMYLLARPLQVSLLAISALGGTFLFYKTSNPCYIYSAALMFSLVPYTKILLYPINHKLLNIRKHGHGEDRNVEEMLIRWDALHFGRTAIGYGALLLVLYGALRTPSGRVNLK